MGTEPVLMTVAPIGGDQILPGLAAEYDRFVEAGRRAARLESVRLCDANALMKIMISGMNERQTSDYLLADNWHPNDRGHAVYAQLLYEALASEKWFMASLYATVIFPACLYIFTWLVKLFSGKEE